MDTENKRRSAVGLYGLRTVPPVPGVEASSLTRRHTASLYAMDPQARASSFWVPAQLTAQQGWKQDGDTSQTWVESQDGSSTWKPVLETDE